MVRGFDLFGGGSPQIYDTGQEYINMVGGIGFGGTSVYREATRIRLLWGNMPNAGQRAFVTDIPIDLTNVSYILHEVQFDNHSTVDRYLICSTVKNGNFETYDYRELLPNNQSNRTIRIADVRDLTGEYYVRYHIRNNSIVTGQLNEYILRIMTVSNAN